ncbi:hypothetical protein [Halorussus sp. MSC15.2]|uniref:hypothetical protein n=1 Tax=Halorussus sp. MSC15.2 TaxID=2283638 RepID=UPI001966E63C|nr:hypothetical protein [Halorussus sp. MSC15.2]
MVGHRIQFVGPSDRGESQDGTSRRRLADDDGPESVVGPVALGVLGFVSRVEGFAVLGRVRLAVERGREGFLVPLGPVPLEVGDVLLAERRRLVVEE